MSLFNPFTKQVCSFLTLRQGLGWRFAILMSAPSSPFQGLERLNAWNLWWMEKLDSRLPWRELTLALLNHWRVWGERGLGKEWVFTRGRARPPRDSAPLGAVDTDTLQHSPWRSP